MLHGKEGRRAAGGGEWCRWQWAKGGGRCAEAKAEVEAEAEAEVEEKAEAEREAIIKQWVVSNYKGGLDSCSPPPTSPEKTKCCTIFFIACSYMA